MALVNYYNGEPWFDNPSLILANRPKRKKGRVIQMRKNKSKSARRARRNFYTAGALANRPRRKARSNRKHHARRSYAHNRRHYRRNAGEEKGAQFLGFTLPPLEVVAWSAAGLVAPGMVAGWIMPMVPASWTTNTDGTPNQMTNFAIKAASVLVPSMLIRSMVSKRGGNIMLVAGAASLVVQAIKTFAPSVATQFGLGAQPFLSEYVAPRLVAAGGRRLAAAPGSGRAAAGVPSRLDPANRF